MKLGKRIISTILTVITVSLACAATANADYTHFPPSGYGKLHTYTVWDTMDWIGDCRQLINYGYNNHLISDSYGIVKYGDYFAGATTTTLGRVGDLLLVVEEHGVICPIIIQDIKSQNDTGCNAWGHYNGQCMVEFEILSCMKNVLYKNGSGSYISELLNRPIYKVINIGSIYDNTTSFKDVKQACKDYGLNNYYILTSPYGGENV